ncbi:MAG TPA: TIGR03560 family F420-dependent LLM class oxidoreductase [Candidatus Dormibacteraeota bacterium]|nr:TIGR03560 family F420-dependent LLM class oxidoreductase [Candidatus Dormibacteraeota bacterium]
MAYIGLHVPSFTYPGLQPAELFPRVADIATTAEASGFTALSVMDHFHQIAPQGSQDEPIMEAYTTLAALAARTSRLELLTLVAGVVYHNPAHLAKQVTTLDVISGGRAILGVGAAWFEQEARAYDFSFPPIRERMDRLEDAVRICRAMFDAPCSTVEGTYHRVEGAFNVPRPLRRVPIMIGGGGERRTLRLVARHADLCNIIGDPATVRHKLGVLRGHCEAEDRDFHSIVKTAHAGIVVADEDEAGLRRRLEALAANPPPVLQGLDAGQLRQRLICGSPDEIAERLRPIREAGADGITMSIRGVHELRPIELVARAATAVFG